jgi:hypothetical protein
MPRPSHSSRFYHPHKSGWGVHIMKLRVILSWMYIHLHIKHPSFLSDFHETWNFSPDFKKNTCQILWKSVQRSRIVPCRRLDRQTGGRAGGQTRQS